MIVATIDISIFRLDIQKKPPVSEETQGLKERN